LFYDHSAGEHQHAGRKLLDELVVVRGHDQRPALTRELLERAAKFRTARRIKRGGRFVEQEQGRIDRQRARNRDPLRLASG
jgi:hypothetical protein